MNEKETIEKWKKAIFEIKYKASTELGIKNSNEIVDIIFKAGQKSENDCVICNENYKTLSCQFCIGKQIEQAVLSERKRILEKVEKDWIFPIIAMFKGQMLKEDLKEWKEDWIKYKVEATTK